MGDSIYLRPNSDHFHFIIRTQYLLVSGEGLKLESYIIMTAKLTGPR